MDICLLKVKIEIEVDIYNDLKNFENLYMLRLTQKIIIIGIFYIEFLII